MKDLYNTNDAFRRYVDAYTKKHHITKEEALEHRMVIMVGEQYRKAEVRNNERRTDTEVHRCGC
jgi:hypothetical protein